MIKDLGFKSRLTMVGTIFGLIILYILFSIFLLIVYILSFIPMLCNKKIFTRYTYFFITRTKINGKDTFKEGS